MRCLALIKLDKFSALERDVGATASEQVLVEFARLLKETLHPKEIVGRFGGVSFLVLLERGNEHDVEAWSEQLLARVHEARLAREGQVACRSPAPSGLIVVPPGEMPISMR